MHHPTRRSPRFLAAATLLACQGEIAQFAPSAGEPGRPRTEPSTAVPPVTAAEKEAARGCSAIDAETGTLHRLTRREHENAVRDLLQLESVTLPGLPRDVIDANGFEGGESAPAALVERLAQEADVLAGQALVRNPPWAACDPMPGGESGCAGAFVDAFVTRAYRRPPTAAERGRYLALFAAVRKTEPYREAIAALISAALQSPAFLYRIETGVVADGPLRRLTPWEAATRLSFALWQTMPDEELFAAARSGKLAEGDERRRQAERMLRDPRARAAAGSFHLQWFGLSDGLAEITKAASLNVRFDDALKASMRESTAAFSTGIFFGDGSTLADLLLSSRKHVDARLAPLYGVTAPATGKMTEVELPPGERPGLLSELSLLTMLAYEDQTNPIKRGEFVRAALLCQELPAPPANVVVNVPPPRPGTTTRQRFVQHREDPSCAGCHDLLDPVGLGFEAYDAVGRRRSSDGGQAIDDSGHLTAVEGVEGPFRGLRDLAERLSRSPAVRTCVAKQWFRYLYGRHEGERDRCAVEAGINALAGSGGRLATLVPALVASPGFVRKRVE